MKVLRFSRLWYFSLLALLLSACSPTTSWMPSSSHPTSTVPAVTEKGTVISVKGTQWGVSTCYIGATEGSSDFNSADFIDLGINSYHVYGGMSRWEYQDDSSIYGWPTIDQIKANPDVINWSWWDNAMTNPPNGSDYWWSYQNSGWHGNARTFFSTLKADHIRTLLTLRNVDNNHNPSWIANPPTTQADWNEWWEHVFATVYWLNVRNDYNVNDFEVLNEPNAAEQGWKGNEAQYITLFHYTADAIKYVYHTYLLGRSYHIYGAAGSTGNAWTKDLLQQIPDDIDTVDIHDYDPNILPAVQRAHLWLNETHHTNSSVWLSEWGSYAQNNKYDTAPVGVSIINNLIRGSEPGNNYVYGSNIFSLYDYDAIPFGLISSAGTRRLDYYALRMAIRALQGCCPTYQSTVNTPGSSIQAITTRSTDGHLSLLITNSNSKANQQLTADLSALLHQGSGTIRQFDAQHQDQVVGYTLVQNGRMKLTVPAQGALLVDIIPSY
ncbi:hypothetical protein [Dictyobacter formicarum]|uniref:hypothetical protein n=1 Tax=Dictyobacter formicarum TaxID=2778368 RepID=UPI001915CBDF|nr:hypothetical protein [Dictyobacter formicarum]